MDTLPILATTNGSAHKMWVAVAIVAVLLAIIGWWRVFTKAGKPGWASIVPIYNIYVLLQIAGRPGWWLLLYLVPFVNVVVHIVVAIDVAKRFGQTTGFGVIMLWLLMPFGYMILGYGNATYKAPKKR